MRFMSFSFLIALAACDGSSEDPDPTPTPTPTPASTGYQGAATVAGAGSISGVVTYTGDQTDAMLQADKDLETCGHEHPERPAGALLVADGKLANAVIYLADIESGKPFDVGTVTVDNIECAFVPHVALGQKGGKVATKNSDPVLHNTNLTLIKGKKKIANIALPKQDQIIEKPLKKSGLVDVKCDAHEWMQGYIYVVENPYVAISDENGAFTMVDVPSGTHTATIWHEVLGDQTAEVTVAEGGAATLDIVFN